MARVCVIDTPLSYIILNTSSYATYIEPLNLLGSLARAAL